MLENRPARGVRGGGIGHHGACGAPVRAGRGARCRPVGGAARACGLSAGSGTAELVNLAELAELADMGNRRNSVNGVSRGSRVNGVNGVSWGNAVNMVNCVSGRAEASD